MQSTSQIAAAHRVGLQDIVDVGMRGDSTLFWPEITGQTGSDDQAFYRVLGKSDMPNAAIISEEGGAFPIHQVLAPFTLDVYPVMRGFGYAVTAMAKYTDQYGFVERGANDLVDAMKATDEVEMANVYNQGFTAPSSGGTPTLDNVAWFSTSHPLLSGTASNYDSSLTLSQTNLEEAEEAILSQVTHRGKPYFRRGNMKLVVPPALKNLAFRLCGSDKMPQSADNDINPQKGLIMPVVNPYLTNTLRWFLIPADKKRIPVRRLTHLPYLAEVEYVKNGRKYQHYVSRAISRYVEDWRGTWAGGA